MTHSPLPMARLLMRPDVRRAAIIYDFIPHDWPQQYLSSQNERIAYATCLTWLRRFDHFLPISRYTSERLQELLDVTAQRCTVTGVSVRESLLPPNGTANLPVGDHVLVVGGGDSRKNPEVAIRAHGGSARITAAGIRLLIAGAYPDHMQQNLRAVHERAGGRPDLVALPAEDLRRRVAALLRHRPVHDRPLAHRGLLHSHHRGFRQRLPGAGLQLRRAGGASGRSRRPVRPRRQRDAAPASGASGARSEGARADARPSGGHLAPLHRREGRAALLGGDAEAGGGPGAGSAARQSAPGRLLSPLPPAASGVADYSFATLGPLAARADVDVFSDTPDARVPDGVRFAGGTSALAHLHPRFDAVVSVIGNSHFHRREFDLLMRYGSAAIAHDARMLDFYRYILGEQRALAAASDELGRFIERDELKKWLHNERTLEALFLKEIAEAAYPVMVHSPISAAYIKERYNIQSALLLFVPYKTFRVKASSARMTVRRGLGHSRRPDRHRHFWNGSSYQGHTGMSVGA